MTETTERLADPTETFGASNGNVVNRRRWQLANIGGSAIKSEFALADNGPRGYEVEECEVAEVVLDAVLPHLKAETRAAVVKALRAEAATLLSYENGAQYPDFDGGYVTGMNQAGDGLNERADAIENGADY